jgi:uncharacterized membrane protein
VVRLLSINQSLWLDEATSATAARDFTFNQIFTQFLPGDFHPPGYYIALKAWVTLFGSGTVTLRVSSVLAGVASVYIVYKIGKLLKNETLGTIAALLLATAPLHIYYSQEVRMYSLSTLLATISIYFYIRVQNKPKKSDWYGFGFSLALSLFVDYLPMLFLAPIWAHALLKQRRAKAQWIKSFLLAHIPLIASLIIIYPLFSSQLAAGLAVKTNSQAWWGILGQTNLKNIVLIPVKFLLGRISPANNNLYALLTIVAGGLYAYTIKFSLAKFKNYKILYLWLILPLLLGAAIGLVVPVLTYFRFLFVLPALYLLAAAGLVEAKEKHFVPLLSALLLLNISFSYAYLSTPRYQREDWRGLVQYVSANSILSTPHIVFPANSQMEAINYYANNERFLVTGPDIVPDNEADIYLVRYVQDIFDPEDTTRLKVENLDYKKTSELDFNGVLVWKYEKISELPPEPTPSQGEIIDI